MSGVERIAAELLQALDVAEAKAWEALARYKFQMFGYWAAIWVHLNRIGGSRRANPWANLVTLARARPPHAAPTAVTGPLFVPAPGKPSSTPSI